MKKKNNRKSRTLYIQFDTQFIICHIKMWNHFPFDYTQSKNNLFPQMYLNFHYKGFKLVMPSFKVQEKKDTNSFFSIGDSLGSFVRI